MAFFFLVFFYFCLNFGSWAALGLFICGFGRGVAWLTVVVLLSEFIRYVLYILLEVFLVEPLCISSLFCCWF